jgi:hypothetical protein
MRYADLSTGISLRSRCNTHCQCHIVGSAAPRSAEAHDRTSFGSTRTSTQPKRSSARAMNSARSSCGVWQVPAGIGRNRSALREARSSTPPTACDHPAAVYQRGQPTPRLPRVTDERAFARSRKLAEAAKARVRRLHKAFKQRLAEPRRQSFRARRFDVRGRLSRQH